ncbi:DUF7409 domain-containing protein [Halorubrum vacuolatum]|uniref:DUF7409 domain-containing protein n=1 Tax=Halorubrum vacuolatum TaxID=63740 RepID=A0A238XJH6_HALVU|nr:helix-hairpin-helix domain-containing protein [Halorubrum vacuolatum]SNR58633.1 hypothetical protein SAMN06264855_11834 [Halorubrum vacuolatum]
MADADADESPEDSVAGSDEPAAISLRWVGEATAETLSASSLSAADIRSKRVSYRQLVDAGVNPGVAAKIRREHSLSWSFEAGEGLDRRSTQVRGLGRAEAAWVAASAGDWETATERPGDSPKDSVPAKRDDATTDDSVTSGSGSAAATADGSGDPLAAEAAWRERSKPTPISTLPAVADDTGEETGDAGAEALLAEAGIISVKSLATADYEHVADVLGLDRERVERWHAAARDAYE